MIAPVDLGQALAFPEVYMQWPAELPALGPALRVRRPGRVRRKVAALASVAVAAGLAMAGRSAGVLVAHGAVRPSWGGRHPAARTGSREPVHDAGMARRHSAIQGVRRTG